MSDRCLCSTGYFFPHRKENCALNQALRTVGLCKDDVTVPVDVSISESVNESTINYVTSPNVELENINISDVVTVNDNNEDSVDGVDKGLLFPVDACHLNHPDAAHEAWVVVHEDDIEIPSDQLSEKNTPSLVATG